MDFILNMMDFALKMMDFILNMMDFILNMMDFALKMMKFPLRCLPITDRALADDDRRGGQLCRGGCARRDGVHSWWGRGAATGAAEPAWEWEWGERNNHVLLA